MKSPNDSALEFHERTKMLPARNVPGLEPRPMADARPVPLALFGLPAVRAWVGGVSLEASIGRRATSRLFDESQPLSSDLLARLLKFSCGLTHATLGEDDGGQLVEHRAQPSAGATYPIEAYFLISNVSVLPCGVYRYDARSHTAVWLRTGRFGRQMAGWTMGQPWLARASVHFLLTGRHERIRHRYAARGYRYMLFEAGHIAQNLSLLGTAYGLATQAVGGFEDETLARLLRLPAGEDVLYLVAVGHRRSPPV